MKTMSQTEPAVPRRSATPDSPGFTFIELLVVVATLALLAAVFLPAQARSRVSSKAVQCLNNNRQLCMAWRMYADDNHDRIVYASDDGTGSANPLNQYAWTSSHLDFNPSNRGNWDTNYDITVRPLWPYTSENAAIYRCPSDPSYVVVSGVVRPRIRSMSMNLFLGGFLGTDGGWAWADPYRIYTRTSQFSGYGGLPAKIFVFLDQRFDSINWGSFMMHMTGYDPLQPAAWEFDEDLPGMYHDRACGFSFVDGHCEMKRWFDPRTTPAYGTIPIPLPSPSNPDVYWLQDHSTRKK